MKLVGAVLVAVYTGTCGAQMTPAIPGSVPAGYTPYTAMVYRSEMASQAMVAVMAANRARMNAMSAAVATATRNAAVSSQQTATQNAGAPAPVLPPFRPIAGMLYSVKTPEPSVPAGPVKAGTQVKLATPTHYSTLYYTTDGWTPTPQSARYTGPLTINETMHFQIIAIGPNMQRSEVSRLDYTVDGSKPAELKPAKVQDGVLRAGTPLRLEITGAEVNSKDASVGDTLPMVLAQDVMDGEKVFAAKGTPIVAVLTNADKKSKDGPGDLVFEVKSMTVHGQVIPLVGAETLEGEEKKEAVIVPGMMLTAVVGAEVEVK